MYLFAVQFKVQTGSFAESIKVGIIRHGCCQFEVLIFKDDRVFGGVKDDLIVRAADNLEAKRILGVFEIVVSMFGSLVYLGSLKSVGRVWYSDLFLILVCDLSRESVGILEINSYFKCKGIVTLTCKRSADSQSTLTIKSSIVLPQISTPPLPVLNSKGNSRPVEVCLT